ncbi:hypothetical protein L208DRAFT_1411242 [Tricholoma matsutake]|nr:hypothetical protein L208DRAFT_1411242 [Tricholoma matsutake 945]
MRVRRVWISFYNYIYAPPIIVISSEFAVTTLLIIVPQAPIATRLRQGLGVCS